MNGNRDVRLLSRAESLELLATGVIGRVALGSDSAPAVLPVSYVLDDDGIVFRSGPGAKLEAAQDGAVVAFEVDDFNTELRIGWSVLVTGVAKRLTTAQVKALGIETWLDPGEDGGCVRIDTTVVSGRRIAPVRVGGREPGGPSHAAR